MNYQAEPGGAQLNFFVLHLKANRERAPGAPPLNLRLSISHCTANGRIFIYINLTLDVPIFSHFLALIFINKSVCNYSKQCVRYM